MLVAGVYLVAAVVFHFVFTAWRKGSGKPATQGYLLTWSVVALSGAVLFIIYFSLVSAAQNIAERGRITPMVLKECRELIKELPNSPLKNGVIVLGLFSSNPENEQGRRSLLLLNPDGSLLRSIPCRLPYTRWPGLQLGIDWR